MKQLMIFYLVASTGFAISSVPHNNQEEIIQSQVDKAVEDFRTVATEAREQLLKSLQSAADRAQRTGDFEKLAEIQAEKTAFDSFGVVPTAVSSRTFDRQMATARRRLTTSYESAVESLTRLGAVEAARKAQQDLDSFCKNGILKTLEIELLDDQLTAWRPDNASLPHWSIRKGILRFDGTQGEKATLFTQRSFRNFSFRCEWRIGPRGDSGIFLRGVPQVQIWDHTRGNGQGIGSGGLFNNQKSMNAPIEIADKPIGQWNTMTIMLVGDRATVTLNGKRVTDNTKMENYPKRKSPLPAEGPIGLQAFHSPIEFRNVMVLELP